MFDKTFLLFNLTPVNGEQYNVQISLIKTAMHNSTQTSCPLRHYKMEMKPQGIEICVHLQPYNVTDVLSINIDVTGIIETGSKINSESNRIHLIGPGKKVHQDVFC